jgi:hypothetical protein
MTTKLQGLLRDARNREMSAEERTQQRQSYAYGNLKLENDRVTKAAVAQAAARAPITR